MFSLMANCFQWMKKRREPSKKVTLVLIGLDNAGKTTTILGIQGESQEDVAPTVGFSSTQFKFEKFDVTVFDLGGGKKIRPIWKNYYAEIHGVVFVIDASDETRLRECQEVLLEVLKQERVAGKRILILANKQDKEGALDEIDICDQLNLEDMVNDSKCPCRVETCSATKGVGKKMDKSVSVGLEWLLQGILRDWPILSARVEREMEEQAKLEAIEKKAKMERIRKRIEERERKQEEERKLAGEPPPEDDEGDVVVGDPFKAVTKDYLNEKTEKSKKLKAAEKKKKLALEKLNNATVETDGSHDENSNENNGITQNASEAQDRSAEAAARLRGAVGDAGERDDDGNETGEGHVERKSEAGLQEADEADVISTQEVPEKKKKKKKKKLKKNNKLAPLPLDGPIEGVTGPLTVPSWASTMNQRPLTRLPHQPTLDPLPERISPRLDPLGMKTSLNGDKVVGIPSSVNRPNLDQDDDVLT